jgi:hypothetical protein
MRRIVLALAALPALAHAARPFVTDDARIVDPGGCQLESWAKARENGNEFWLLPACNPFGNLEISAGLGELRPDGAEPSRDKVLQVKTLFRELKPNGVGWGMAAGAVARPGPEGGGNRLSSVYAYFPVSASFRDDQWVVHANLGLQREREAGQTSLTWGLGTEAAVGSRLYAIGETYGDNRQNPFWQFGLRYWIVPGKVQVDATRGGEASRGGHWFSIGLRLIGGDFF